jgi:hypothetical protein
MALLDAVHARQYGAGKPIHGAAFRPSFPIEGREIKIRRLRLNQEKGNQNQYWPSEPEQAGGYALPRIFDLAG